MGVMQESDRKCACVGTSPRGFSWGVDSKCGEIMENYFEILEDSREREERDIVNRKGKKYLVARLTLATADAMSRRDCAG